MASVVRDIIGVSGTTAVFHKICRPGREGAARLYMISFGKGRRRALHACKHESLKETTTEFLLRSCLRLFTCSSLRRSMLVWQEKLEMKPACIVRKGHEKHSDKGTPAQRPRHGNKHQIFYADPSTIPKKRKSTTPFECTNSAQEQDKTENLELFRYIFFCADSRYRG